MLNKTDYFVELKNLDLTFPDGKTSLNNPTGRFFYDPWKIKDQYKNTVWEDLLNTIPFPIGEARIIKMSPGTTYMAHADIDDRLHLSLQGELSYLIDISNNQMHLLSRDSTWYEMDAGRIHVACNFGSIDRYQLVVRKLLIESTALEKFINVKIKPADLTPDYRYKFDNYISPWLNYANKNNAMKNFNYTDSVVTLQVTESELKKLQAPDYFIIEQKEY
jgi:hypothetical protein